ncbi:MAG: PAS domain S-box protein [Betaproteobacteria bacterium]|nr:PAS domain S-box protein [Betaproteobacteria bacterium]
MWQEGFPDYRIKPELPRDEYYSIVYLEPFSARNARSFGYDMMTEPVRRAAQELARDTGQPALSGKVMLVLETDQDVQAGFIVYLPVYRQGAAASTVAERREAIIGFVFSPFRANNLMHGIMGNAHPDVDFKIYDGPDVNGTALLHDSAAAHGEAPSSHEPTYRVVRQVEIAGRIWTLVFTSTPSLEAAAIDHMPAVVAAGGLAVNLVLLYVIFASSRLRRRAERLSADHAATLDRTVKLRTITDSIPLLIAYVDRDQRYRFTNEAFHLKYGGDAVAIIGRTLRETAPDGLYALAQPYVFRALAGEKIIYDKREPSGRVTESTYLLQRDAGGAVVGFYVLIADITERKRIEDEPSEQARILTQANIDIEQFAYIASHDLKAPLRGIGLLAEWITEELGDTAPPNVTYNLARLRRRAMRMESLMESLLAYSRAGRGANSA